MIWLIPSNIGGQLLQPRAMTAVLLSFLSSPCGRAALYAAILPSSPLGAALSGVEGLTPFQNSPTLEFVFFFLVIVVVLVIAVQNLFFTQFMAEMHRFFDYNYDNDNRYAVASLTTSSIPF